MRAKLQRRVSVITLAAVSVWLCAYYITESAQPIHQVYSITARYAGFKSERTVREINTSEAIFHLRQAMNSIYNSEKFNSGRYFPDSWETVVRETHSYVGSHMKGSLSSNYPFLAKPLDPWGRHWVYRVIEYETNDEDFTCLQITFGSLGPDGIECPQASEDYDTRRRNCDDLIGNYICTFVPRTIVPPDTPKQPFPKVTVDPVLWGGNRYPSGPLTPTTNP